MRSMAALLLLINNSKKKLDDRLPAVGDDRIFQMIEPITPSARCFIVPPSVVVGRDDQLKDNVGDRPMSLPFRTITIEAPEPIPLDEENVFLNSAKRFERKSYEYPVFIGLLVHEVSPDTLLFAYIFGDLCNLSSKPMDPRLFSRELTLMPPRVRIVGGELDVKNQGEFDGLPILKNFLRFLNLKTTIQGKSRTPHVFKRRAGADLVKPFVILGSKKDVNQSKRVFGHKVEWTHTWEVCGHWRKIKGIGKNREGEYVMSGFTWVVEHKKGDGEFIKKTRIALNSKTVEGTTSHDL